MNTSKDKSHQNSRFLGIVDHEQIGSTNFEDEVKISSIDCYIDQSDKYMQIFKKSNSAMFGDSEYQQFWNYKSGIHEDLSFSPKHIYSFQEDRVAQEASQDMFSQARENFEGCDLILNPVEDALSLNFREKLTEEKEENIIRNISKSYHSIINFKNDQIVNMDLADSYYSKLEMPDNPKYNVDSGSIYSHRKDFPIKYFENPINKNSLEKSRSKAGRKPLNEGFSQRKDVVFKSLMRKMRYHYRKDSDCSKGTLNHTETYANVEKYVKMHSGLRQLLVRYSSIKDSEEH